MNPLRNHSTLYMAIKPTSNHNWYQRNKPNYPSRFKVCCHVVNFIHNIWNLSESNIISNMKWLNLGFIALNYKGKYTNVDMLIKWIQALPHLLNLQKVHIVW